MKPLTVNSDTVSASTRARLGRSFRPRVLHLITSFDIGGTERQAAELVNRLNDERFDVRLAVLHKRGALLDQVASRFTDIKSFPLTCFYNIGAGRQLLKLRSLLVNERISILHAHDFYSGILGAAAARLTKTKVIAAQRHLRLSDRAIHEWGSRIIHKLSHRLIVNSEAIRDHILSENRIQRNKIIVIRNGLNATENLRVLREQQRQSLCLELGLDINAPDLALVGSVARLQPVKGHRYLIDAAAQILQSHRGAHFVLVGDGDLRNEIIAQANRLQIAERVHLLGDRKDASKIVAAFDVAVLASLHEGLPNAVMEAMVAGVPVVATAVGGVKELIENGETGFLAPPANAEELAQKISFILSHREPAQFLAIRGRHSIVERFGMERMVESVEQLYEEVLGSQS